MVSVLVLVSVSLSLSLSLSLSPLFNAQRKMQGCMDTDMKGSTLSHDAIIIPSLFAKSTKYHVAGKLSREKTFADQ